MFPFENLKVYQRALAWNDDVESLIRRLESKLSRSFIDQLTRASLSIALNIAEGNGRWHKREKRNFFWIARGSLFECVPLLQILHRRKLISDAEYQHHYCTLEALGKMLTKLTQSTESKASAA